MVFASPQTISRRSWFSFRLKPFPGGHGFRFASNHFPEVMVFVSPQTISRRSRFSHLLKPFPGGHGFRFASNHFLEVMVNPIDPFDVRLFRRHTVRLNSNPFGGQVSLSYF